MTTYKLVLIPHRQIMRGMNPPGAYCGADDRYFPFGHLPKEYLQVLPIELCCLTHSVLLFDIQIRGLTLRD